MDKAEAKHIKASFQWAVWSVCPSASLSSVESGGQLCGQSRNIKYAAAFPNFGRCEGRGRLDLAGGMERDIWGFLSETWKSICAGGHAALWGLSVFAMYLRGKYEYLMNESQAQGRCSEGAEASQNQAVHVHTRTICPPVKHRPKMSLTLQIPENLICGHANSPQRGCLWGSSRCSTNGKMVRDVCEGACMQRLCKER